MLPGKDLSFIDCPMPFIIGKEGSIDQDDIPEDVTYVKVRDAAHLYKRHSQPALPAKEHKLVMA